ncbi:hypothetical protein ACOSP7_019189 [Xanthoceras sorbifolium]
MSNSGSEQRDHQHDHGTAMGDRDEGGGIAPSLHLGRYINILLYNMCKLHAYTEIYNCGLYLCFKGSLPSIYGVHLYKEQYPKSS